MASDTTVSIGTKRQVAYSLVSLLTVPLLLISITSTDAGLWISEKRELPFDTLLFIGLAEFLKVCWVVWLFPKSDFIDADKSVTGFVGEDETRDSSRLRLPLSRKDTTKTHARPVSRSGLVSKFVEIFWGISGFIGSIAICHVLLILFGAPFFQDWTLTLQLSFILVSWLFFPLCLVLPPATILSELFYISIWDYDEFGLLVVAKWRFLVTCICTWMGAIVVPLDWDRPWQKWPIPCLVSATASQLLINIFICLYYLPRLTCFKAKTGNVTTGKGINKVKAI